MKDLINEIDMKVNHYSEEYIINSNLKTKINQR